MRKTKLGTEIFQNKSQHQSWNAVMVAHHGKFSGVPWRPRLTCGQRQYHLRPDGSRIKSRHDATRQNSEQTRRPMHFSLHIYFFCIYAYMYTYTRIQNNIHKHIHTYLPTYIHAYIRTYIHAYIPMCAHTDIHAYRYVSSSMLTYIDASIHLSIRLSDCACMQVRLSVYHFAHLCIHAQSAYLVHE